MKIDKKLADVFRPSKERPAALRRMSGQLGMSYEAEEEYGMINLLKDFGLFRKGFRKKIHNLLHLRNEDLELDYNLFDYQYTIKAGNAVITRHQSVFFIQSKRFAVPEFQMRPEHFFHRIGTYLGMQDIDFVDHPVFSKKYLLQGPDEEMIRYKLDPKFRDYFSENEGWTVEGINYFLIFYRDRRLIAPAAFPHYYRKGMHIAQLLLEEA